MFKSPTMANHDWLFIGMDKQSFQNSTIEYQQLDQKNMSKTFKEKTGQQIATITAGQLPKTCEVI